MIFALLENPYLPRVLFTHKRDVLAPSTIFSTSLMGIEKSRLSPNSEMKSRWLSLHHFGKISIFLPKTFYDQNLIFETWNWKLTSEDLFTVFEKSPICLIWVFQFWHFPPIFVLLKLNCQVTLFDYKLQVFKKSSKWTIFGIFHELLSPQNINVARFARNVLK